MAAAAAGRVVFRRYGDVLVNLARVQSVHLDKAGMLRWPHIDFYVGRVLSFSGQGPDSRPLRVAFETPEDARAEFEALARLLPASEPAGRVHF
jgi:hypothetical protein